MTKRVNQKKINISQHSDNWLTTVKIDTIMLYHDSKENLG